MKSILKFSSSCIARIQVINVLKTEVVEGTYRRIEDAKILFDQKIFDALQIHNEISNNIYMNPAFISENDYHRHNAVKTLNYFSNSSNYDGIFLFYYDCKGILGNDGWTSLDTFLDKSLAFSLQKNKREIQNMLLSDKAGNFHRFVDVSSNNEASDSFIITFDIPLNSVKPHGKILFYLSNSSLKTIFDEILGNNDGSVMVFKNDEIIFSYGEKEYQDLGFGFDFTSMTNHNFIKEIDYEKTEVAIMQVVSKKSGLKYVSVLSPGKYLNPVIRVKNKSTRLILIITLAGIILSFFVAKNYYKPIKKIKDMIIPNYIKDESSGDEISEIEGFIKSSLLQNLNLKSKVEEQMELIQEYVLIKVLRGDYINPTQLDDMVNSHGISFGKSGFLVMILNTMDDITNSVTTKEVSLLLESVLSKSIKEGDYRIVSMLKGNIVIIINISKELITINFITDIWLNIKMVFNKLKNINIMAGVGRVYNSMDGLKCSYSEAIYALENNKIENCILFYDDVLKSDYPSTYWYPIDEQNRLEHCIKQGNTALIDSAVKDLIKNLKNSESTLRFKIVICYGVLNSLFRLIHKYNIDGLMSSIEEAFIFENIEEFSIKLNNLSLTLCQIFEEKVSKSEKFDVALRGSILEYINEMYMDNSISLEQVATKYGVSSSYLSTMFKEIAGCNFTSYITRLRINFAKNLLINTEKPIKEIVEDIGYIDVVSFTKTFKKIEGLTPGRYRRIMNN